MDAGPAERALTGLQDNVRRTDAVVKDVGRTVGVTGHDIEKVIASIVSSTKSGSDQVTKKLDEVIGELGKVREASHQTQAANKEHTTSISEMTSAVSAMPGPVGDAASAFSRLTSVVGKFIKSPLLWFLAAAAAAYQYLTWSLSRTVEGQEKLDVATAKYHQRLENVKDAASAFGRTIYDVMNRAAGVADRLLSKLGGIGRVLGSLSGGAFGGGIGSAVGGLIGDWTWNRNVSEASSLASRENALWQKRKSFKVEEAELERQISEERARAYDLTLSVAEREEAVKQAVAATNELYDKRKKIAEETRDIAVGRLGLSDSDRDAEMAAEQAKADVVNLETQRQNALRFLNRMDSSIESRSASLAKKDSEAAKKLLEQRDALFQQQMQQDERQAQQAIHAANAQEEARIASIENEGERERAERKHQHELRLQQIKQQADAMRKANYEAAKKAYEAANPGKKYSQTEEGAAGWSSVALTTDQSKEIEAAKKKENAIYARYIKERFDSEIQAMRDYLKEYGTIEEQRYAISKEYDEKIAKEADEWRRKSLEAEKKSKLSQLNAQSLAADIDWGKTFSGIGTVLEGIAKETVEKIEKYMKSAEFKALPAIDKKAYTDLLNEIRSEVGFGASNPLSPSTWQNIANLTEQYQQSVRDVLTAQGVHKRAVDTLIEAEEKLKNATTDEAKAMAEAEVSIAKAVAQQTATGVRQAQQVKQEKGDELNQAAESATEGLNSFGTAMNGILSGSLKGFADGVVRIAGLLSGDEKLAKGLEGIGTKAAGLVALILQLIDTLGDKPVEFIDDLFDKLSRTVEAIIANLPEIITHVFEGIADIIKGVFTGIFSWFGRSREEQEKTAEEKFNENIERNSKAIDNLSQSIDLLSDAISDASISKAIELTRTQIAALERMSEEVRDSFLKAATYFNTDETDYGKRMESVQNQGIWKAAQGLTQTEKDLLRQAIIESGSKSLWVEAGEHDGMYYDAHHGSLDLAKLDGKDWYTIATQFPDLYDKIKQLLSEGNQDASQYLDNWLTYWKEVEDAEDRLREKLTNITFDTLKSDFSSVLMDMDKGAEDLSGNFEKYLRDALINAMVVDQYNSDLEEWYKEFAEYMEQSKGNLSDQDIDYLKGKYDEIVDKAIDARDTLASIHGWTDGAKQDLSSLSIEIDEVMSSIMNTITNADMSVEEWAKDFKKKLAQGLVEATIFTDADMEVIKQAGNRIAQGLLDGLDPEEMQDEFDLINAYVSKGKTVYEGMMEAWGLTDNQEEELATPFENLKDDILDSLTDLENGAEDFKKKMSEAMIKDVIEKMVLGNEVERENADGSWTVFNTFNDWLEDWQQRYSDILNDATLSDEEREARLQALVDEAVAVREAEAESAEKFAEKLKDIEEIEHDTTFKDMADEWKSALLDMTADADSFGDKIREMMAEKVMQSMIEARGLQAFLDSQQEAINAIFEGDGSWEEKMEAIQPIIDEMISKYEELAPYAEKIRDAFGITKKQQEAENPFSSLKDSLVDALMDMDSTAKDFGKQIGASLAKEMIAKVVEDKYGERIKTLATALQDAIATGNAELIDQARYALEALYTEIQNDTQAIRETQRVIEELNDTTFTDLRDSFRSAIMDMTADAKSFAQDITQIVTEKLIDRLVLGEGFDKKLEEIQTQYNAIMSSDKSEAEKAAAVAALTQQVAALGVELQDISQDIMDATGWTQIVERMNSPLNDLRSLFRSTLMDMDADANDFLKSIGDTMTEAFIDKFVLGDAFDEQLEEWQDEYAKIMKSDISEEERARQLKQLRDAIANAKESYADAARGIQELMGTAEYQDQSATLNMSDKATYEQMDQYLGTNMGILMATEQGNQVRVQILATLQQMSGLTSTDNPLLSEMRGLMAIGNEYLLDIKRSNREILTSFGAKLSSIDSKLNRVL